MRHVKVHVVRLYVTLHTRIHEFREAFVYLCSEIRGWFLVGDNDQRFVLKLTYDCNPRSDPLR